ncbi:ABC-type transport auxiliary lipoprotein family protein [Achromobacter deleyi]|uniref:ABC-type transport auxiliary lipoprotein family protein n=1 Tax=Achromobacter deleyi TaxID=1353891 RepID=UPI00149163E2|nr:ABC-type transport auxiliary lipoprotein family protein [Achromobacter deleyi]QVQ25606.1 membrane integrity-associated transporter subunit PqiC [Achromobacter deleyi]UIP21146.1 ABC-type transport auxiliary lipoprotein family protein [Achromobacter deleyi]
MKMRSAVLILTLALAGCGIGRVGAPPTVFDLGLDARPVPALPAREPIALTFQAAPNLSDTSMTWRVGDSAAPKSYATYRWASAPAELVRQRIADRLSRQGPVLNDRVNLQTPQLQVSLTQFEQVFTEDGQSAQGRILLQAVLLEGRAVVGQKRILVQAPAPTLDAEGGVAALRQASDEAADQLAQWLATTLRPATTPVARPGG